MKKPFGKLRSYCLDNTSGALYIILRGIYRIWMRIFEFPEVCFYRVCSIFPLQDKVVAATFRGKRYGDNSQFIIEELHKMNPNVKIIWISNKDYDYPVPDYVTKAEYYSFFEKIYHYSTAKVWINTHRMERTMHKRKGQLFIETWHGGLGIKKIELDIKDELAGWEIDEIKNTVKMADLFISNSTHLTNIYRRAFGYKGKIWKVGYPKNDKLLSDRTEARQIIREHYGLPLDCKILMYAPTFRNSVTIEEYVNSTCVLDFAKLRDELEKSWGESWVVFVRWHPIIQKSISELNLHYGDGIIDATSYPDMQELILGTDAMISDYSSAIFDAAFVGNDCLIYATDFENYKKGRGVYYELEDLPFPYAKNEDELMDYIRTFDKESSKKAWDEFKEKMGLHESGHAARDIAYLADEFIKGNLVPLLQVKNDE